MSREEATAKAIHEAWGKHYAFEDMRWGTLAEDALAAADAHDLAHGVHRLTIDDATVERAARAAYYAQFEDGDTPWDHFITSGSSYIDYWRDQARAVLAAAVQEEER